MLLIVWFTNSERRIPIQYAKRVVGRKMYGGQGTNLPLKLNMAGVMPIIFASSIVSIPATLGGFFPNSKFFQGVLKWFNYDKPLYVLIYFILILLFAYFYIAISFNPVEVSNNLKDNGGAIPGIRPGRPTAQFISKILNRITLMGALFLSIISCVPMIIFMIAMAINDTSAFTSLMGQFAFSGSSSIIVVGVALETMREIEAQITMRNYKGFLD
jgi:preprotein translocase subunit SecY